MRGQSIVLADHDDGQGGQGFVWNLYNFAVAAPVFTEVCISACRFCSLCFVFRWACGVGSLVCFSCSV